MATTETIVIKGDELTIDLILYRRFKRPMPGLFERVLDMNRDIAETGPFLPLGAKLVIPIDAPATTPAVSPAVRLWD